MKGAGVMQLMTFLLLARTDTPLARDVVFCGVPDEEAGGVWGMKWLCEHRPDVVDVEFEISEGGTGSSQFLGKPARLFGVATSEKNACRLRLRAVGRPGHGSRPHKDNSLVHLARAIIKLSDWDRAPMIIPETAEYLRRVTQGGLLPEGDIEARLPGLIEDHAALKAMFINTLNATMFHSGIKVNVIPALSEASLDCRLLPGQDREAWRQQVIERIDDPRIEVLFHTESDQSDPGETPWDTELFHLMNEVVTDAMEDAVITPTMTVGGTDNRFLRERGVPAYGFIPALLSPEEAAGFHGNNEKLSIDNLNLGCELMYEVVRRFCGR
jgi:acetylornithine deacetylase/succinyl-diaminopimelate desuccinylase-like protein